MGCRAVEVLALGGVELKLRIRGQDFRAPIVVEVPALGGVELKLVVVRFATAPDAKAMVCAEQKSEIDLVGLAVRSSGNRSTSGYMVTAHVVFPRVTAARH